MDQKTRKLMTKHKTLHLRDDIDYMCQGKEEEDLLMFRSVDASTQGFKD